jgi:hypothetical protein
MFDSKLVGKIIKKKEGGGKASKILIIRTTKNKLHMKAPIRTLVSNYLYF